MPSSRAKLAVHQQQAGFSLVEVSIVTALMVILAIIGIPALQDYIIENKVPKVASDLQRFVARMKVTALGGGETPYENVDQRVLINGVRGGSAVSVRGQAPNGVVVHGLGGRGSAGNGEIKLSPAEGPDLPTGSAFSLTLDHVNHAACPMLVSALQRMAMLVKVAGRGGAVVVKNGFSSPVIPYNPVLADAQCHQGDTNRFVFVFQ
jgi:prepilin-type N-terminal cleavage/methylation domain-containing protein